MCKGDGLDTKCDGCSQPGNHKRKCPGVCTSRTVSPTPIHLRISVPRWRARGQPIDARGARAKHGVKPLPLRPESSHTQETQLPFNTSATFLILPERPTPQSNCGPTPNERNGIGQETHHSGHAHPYPATWAGSWNWNVLPIRWRRVLSLRRKPVCGMRA